MHLLRRHPGPRISRHDGIPDDASGSTYGSTPFETIQAIKPTNEMSNEYIILDTEIYNPFPHFINSQIKSRNSLLIKLPWEEDTDIRMTVHPKLLLSPQTAVWE